MACGVLKRTFGWTSSVSRRCRLVEAVDRTRPSLRLVSRPGHMGQVAEVGAELDRDGMPRTR